MEESEVRGAVRKRTEEKLAWERRKKAEAVGGRKELEEWFVEEASGWSGEGRRRHDRDCSNEGEKLKGEREMREARSAVAEGERKEKELGMRRKRDAAEERMEMEERDKYSVLIMRAGEESYKGDSSCWRGEIWKKRQRRQWRKEYEGMEGWTRKGRCAEERCDEGRPGGRKEEEGSGRREGGAWRGAGRILS